MSVASLWNGLEEQLLPVFDGYRSRLADLPVELKADRTLLTKADIEVQGLIVRAIREMEPDAVIIAEEDERTGPREEVARSGGRVWVVDPIDGTAEFVRPDHVEFCSVICLLEDWQPSAAFVLAPELGAGRSPLLATADARTGELLLDGRPAPTPDRDRDRDGRWLSVTRSSGSPARVFDSRAEDAGYRLKVRTTSQTIDMLRTVMDLSGRTDPPLPAFDLFWRREQKLWDGAAGLCLGAAAGLHSGDEDGKPIPAGPDFLSAPTPVFASTVMGWPRTVAWFLETRRP